MRVNGFGERDVENWEAESADSVESKALTD
jgi:hypothetical protein